MRQPARLLDMREGCTGGCISLALSEVAPGQVVERPAAVGDSPMRHRAVRIELQRLAEALHALRLVEGKAPVETGIEPALRVGRSRGDFPGMAAEVETIHPFAPSSRSS